MVKSKRFVVLIAPDLSRQINQPETGISNSVVSSCLPKLSAEPVKDSVEKLEGGITQPVIPPSSTWVLGVSDCTPPADRPLGGLVLLRAPRRSRPVGRSEFSLSNGVAPRGDVAGGTVHEIRWHLKRSGLLHDEHMFIMLM